MVSLKTALQRLTDTNNPNGVEKTHVLAIMEMRKITYDMKNNHMYEYDREV